MAKIRNIAVEVPFDDLVGRCITSIKEEKDGDVVIHTDAGETYYMYHQQCCCENVGVDEMVGDVDGILGKVVTAAIVDEPDDPPDDPNDAKWGSWTWTVFMIKTAESEFAIRWYGVSNGYYSETVDFVKLTNRKTTRSPWGLDKFYKVSFYEDIDTVANVI